MKFASGVLPPISATAQRVGYGRTLSRCVIVITDRGRHCHARRDPLHNRNG